MKKRTLISVMGTLIVLLNACYYDKEQLLLPPKSSLPTCANYSFTNDVSPILQTSCASGSNCHGAGSSFGPGELITYNEIKNAAVQIKASIEAGRMPLGSSLSSTQLQTISCWVANGGLNN
ncbi:MAG: hypothetical protein ACHQEM_05315 [Chitinophagales bacterium]